MLLARCSRVIARTTIKRTGFLQTHPHFNILGWQIGESSYSTVRSSMDAPDGQGQGAHPISSTAEPAAIPIIEGNGSVMQAGEIGSKRKDAKVDKKTPAKKGTGDELARNMQALEVSLRLYRS